MSNEFVVYKNHKFGWCMPGSPDHKDCRVRFSYYEKDYHCSCDCHDKKFLPPLEAGVNMYPVKPEKPERAPRTTKKPDTRKKK